MIHEIGKSDWREVTEISAEFRQCLRQVGSSVTLLATQLGTERFGMVATAVMSVSMEPPSLVVGINRAASIYAPLLERRAFVVNYLSEDGEDLAQGFSGAKPADRFATGNWSARPATRDDAWSENLPHLRDAQAAIYCKVKDVLVFGTHALVVGEVFDIARCNAAPPLLYCRGAYGSFKQSDRNAIRERYDDSEERNRSATNGALR